MAIRKYTKFEIASIKRTAESINKLIEQRKKATNKIEELTKKVEDLQSQIDVWDTPIKNMTGYSTEDLVEKIKEDNGPAKFVLKYPETVVPATEDIIAEDLENVPANIEIDEEEKIEEIEL